MPALSESLLPSEEDLLYEEEILRNPFNLKLWWRYLQARKDSPPRKRHIIYERALVALPGSYKLWHAYLGERSDSVRGLCINHPSFTSLNNTFERALVTMHKMPRIWLEYLQLLIDQKKFTKTRHTFDRSLRALPATQHDRIWELYLKFVSQEGIPVETALRVYRRFLKFDPTQVESFIEFLIVSQRWQEAAEKLSEVLNDENFFSTRGKTKHQLWLDLCDILTRHATEIKGLKVDAIIRGGIRKFTDEVGRLWTSLADFYVRKGLFEAARDVYEEGMCTVVTVRDFSMIFDAYAQFEESMLAAKMESMADEEEDAGEVVDEELDGNWLIESDDTDLRILRLENLMERRPELVSSVLLRQNPHNVHEWHKRAKLFSENPAKQILTFTEAVKTVDPMKAVGKIHTLWLSFAKLYEKHADLKNARVIFEKAMLANYKSVDDLAAVACEWAEMELRHKNFTSALDVLKRATTEPSFSVKRQASAQGEDRVQLKLYRNLKVWMLYVDLEESLGTLEQTRTLYERIIDLKIATPQIIINYALLLEENHYFEDAFKVYEKGVHIFKYPHVKDIWVVYLTKFVARYGEKKLERARDLFEEAIQQSPSDNCKPLYLQYAKLEEEFGLSRHAMEIYSRAAKAVPEKEKFEIFELYIARAAEFYGLSRTREIYELAIESGLPDADVKKMCLKYASLEERLGEIDRARAIYVHCSQLADPRSDAAFWDVWNKFEINHGNEDTFREMLRIKRTVSASYSQTHFILPEYLMQKASQTPAGMDVPAAAAVEKLQKQISDIDEMAALEQKMDQSAIPSSRIPQFVSAGIQVQDQEKEMAEVVKPPVVINPEEIELPEEEEEEGEEGEEEEKVDLMQKEIPSAVFGALAEKVESGLKRKEVENGGSGKETLGALERFKRGRK